MRRGLALLLLLTLPLLATPMRWHHRWHWAWSDVVLLAVASMTLVYGALVANLTLLGAAALALALGAALNYYGYPDWSRGLIALALLLLAFYVLFV